MRKCTFWAAAMILSAALFTGCSPAAPDGAELTESTATVNGAAPTESTATVTETSVWFLDTGIEWTEAKEAELYKDLLMNYIIPAEPLGFVSFSESGYVEQVKEFQKTSDGVRPIYISAHDEGIMKKLKGEGEIDTYYTLIEETDSDTSTEDGETEFTASADAIEFFGPYFAMILPEKPEIGSYTLLPQTIFTNASLLDLISGPDMTNYITSVDERHYIYKGGSENWDFEYQTDGSITKYDRDGTRSTKSECQNLFTASYKGTLEELNRSKKLEISYKSGSHGGSQTTEGPFFDTVFTHRGGSQGGYVEDGSEKIQVTVTLDGKTDTVELENTVKN